MYIVFVIFSNAPGAKKFQRSDQEKAARRQEDSAAEGRQGFFQSPSWGPKKSVIAWGPETASWRRNDSMSRTRHESLSE